MAEYFCDSLDCSVRIQRRKYSCGNHRVSDLQTWCGLGRIPQPCRVDEAIARGEKPSQSYKQWVKETRQACESARRDLIAYYRLFKRA